MGSTLKLAWCCLECKGSFRMTHGESLRVGGNRCPLCGSHFIEKTLNAVAEAKEHQAKVHTPPGWVQRKRENQARLLAKPSAYRLAILKNIHARRKAEAARQRIADFTPFAQS